MTSSIARLDYEMTSLMDTSLGYARERAYELRHCYSIIHQLGSEAKSLTDDELSPTKAASFEAIMDLCIATFGLLSEDIEGEVTSEMNTLERIHCKIDAISHVARMIDGVDYVGKVEKAFNDSHVVTFTDVMSMAKQWFTSLLTTSSKVQVMSTNKHHVDEANEDETPLEAHLRDVYGEFDEEMKSKKAEDLRLIALKWHFHRGV